MTRRIVCTLAVLGTPTVFAQAQESVPRPTKADAANVVKIISADETKIKNYCKLADIGEEIRKAIGAGDKNKIEQLSKQAAQAVVVERSGTPSRGRALFFCKF
jgi:hypothetical protein